MKTCLISPIPDLDRYVDDLFDHHLLLAHLFALPNGLGKRYAEFYAKRAADGDYLILDNSTKELGMASGLQRSLAIAAAVGAKEVVLSDIRFSAFQTLDATELDLRWLVTHRDEYEHAGKPALMIVPQGGSFPAWHACLVRLLTMVEEAIGAVDGPAPVIGVPYAYGHKLERPFRELVYLACAPGVQVHLLGWPRHLQTLAEIAHEFPQVRSVDSSRPFVYGKHGMIMRPDIDYPGRDEHFFEEPIPLSHAKIVRHNLALFRAYANDETEVPA